MARTASWTPLRHDEDDDGFDDEPDAQRARWGRGQLLALGLTALVLAGALAAVTQPRAAWPRAGGGAHGAPDAGAADGGEEDPPPATPADVDEPVRITSWMRQGIRFAPAGIDLASRECMPFVMDPNRTVRERIEQQPLTAAAARALRTIEPHDEFSWCTISSCAPHTDPIRVFHLQDVCMHNDTLYVLSDRNAPPVVLVDDWWGSPRRPRRYSRFLQEVHGEASVPGTPVWLGGSWTVVTPKFRFGHANIFHAILEEIGWLGRTTKCGAIATGVDHNILLTQRRHLLGRSSTGRLWEIAANGGHTYYLPMDASTAFCFRRLHFESNTPLAPADPSGAACAHVGALHTRPPVWPRWPAGEASFGGFDQIVHAARARVGLDADNGPVAAKWRTPRVTIVHRLKNRRLLNIEYVAWVLRDTGFDVTVVSLECMPLEAQLAVVSNSSTLLGVHGAGLTLGHALPPDALVIELRSAPCTEEARGIPYQMRPRNAIIPAPAVAVMPNASCPPPWKYNRRDYDVVVDIAAVLRTIFDKDPVASARQSSGSRTAAAV
ncbi:hypothetical protein KFE25_000833 [Diacronema lutheri]|uniref:Glycosyltransferase 61 catalytic domain-containing protein n=1 Tax=Diacronema lutheri TaxID=2081491 RepID=A0A8J5XS73_DIALT|nr:hypothetical protein KFE25_000833 [Diacronema lutheri]